MSPELDVPLSSYECAKRYPHLQDLYLSTTVLNWGHVPWSFYPSEDSKTMIPLITLSLDPNQLLINYDINDEWPTDVIFVGDYDQEHEIVSDVVIHRGECRHFLHYREGTVLDSVSADRELVMRAFCIEKMRKFTGIASIRTIDKAVYSISLMPNQSMINKYNIDMIKAYRKYYKVKS